MKSSLFALTSLLVTLLFITIMAQVPKTMSYQGKLSATNGNIVLDGDYSITFKLYDAATDGINLWSEIQITSVENGILM